MGCWLSLPGMLCSVRSLLDIPSFHVTGKLITWSVLLDLEYLKDLKTNSSTPGKNRDMYKTVDEAVLPLSR